MSKLTSMDKVRISRLYLNEEMSAAKIAKIYDIDPTTVLYTLKQMDVPVRFTAPKKRGAKKSMAAIRREVAERRAKIAPMIVTWYKEGLGCHAIKTMLRKMGYTRGTDHTAVVKILHANNVEVRPQGAGGLRSKIPRYVEAGTFCA
jgi:hypothetical protein